MNTIRTIQSLIWVAFLAILIYGSTYTAYIAGWQGWILISATALFALLVLGNALFPDHHDHDHHDHDHGTPLDGWLQTVVHAVPLFLFLALGVTSLGSQQIRNLTNPAPHIGPRAFAQKPITPPATTPATPQQSNDRPDTPAHIPLIDDGTNPEPFVETPRLLDDPVVNAAHLVPLPLLDLYYPNKNPDVVRIETIGRLMIPSDEEKAQAPEDVDRADLNLLLYRYVMNCCAADAAPVFVVLKNYKKDGLEIDTWVKVTGAWIKPHELGDMAKIEVDTLEQIPEPKDPYLQAPK